MLPFYESEKRDIRIIRAEDMTFPPHLHSQLELILVTEGSIEVEISDQQRLLNQDDFAIAFPNTVHSYRTHSGSTSGILLVICNPSWAGSWRSALTQYEPEDPFIIADSLHVDVKYAMSSLYKESESNTPLLKAYIQLALSRTIPLLALHKSKELQHSDSIHRIVGYISENFRKPLKLETLSKEIGISRYYLSRIFRTKLRTGFTDYLNSFRIDLAKTLLETGDKDILQICYDCGFESQRTFNRAFKRECGITPREYRHQINHYVRDYTPKPLL